MNSGDKIVCIFVELLIKILNDSNKKPPQIL